MNKRLFTFLIVLMGISIIGVIAVQLVWINNAIRVKNELFDRSINEALQQTAARLEKKQDVEFLTGLPVTSKFNWSRPDPVAAPAPPKPIKIIRKKLAPGNIDIEFKVENDSATHVFAFSGSGENVNSNSVNKIIASSEDTIITNTHTFFKTRIQQIDSLESLIDTNISISTNLKQRFEVKAEQLKNLSSKVVTELSLFNDNELHLDEVHDILQEELTNKNVPIPFEMALLENDTIQQLSSSRDSLLLTQSLYQVRLFPDAVFNSNQKLSLYFPGQSGFIYRSVSWLLVASLFFSMIILITFAMSIFFILKQKKISEMKSDFINNMTHEFKTPIATISVATDSISNEKVIHNPEQINYFLGMIKKENTRMNRQVEDILTIARLDKKDFEFHWETIDAHELIESAIEGIILQVEKRGGQIDTKLLAGNPMVTSDKTHFTNIIYNLLDNANKYSEDSPQISVLTKNISKGVLISVIDQGIGMSKNVQTHIFERFYRQPSGNIHNVKGFGLGLSYVKAVLEANQGTVSVQSEAGKGSRFDVFVPFLRE